MKRYSNNLFCVARDVTADVYRRGQPRDVSRRGFNVNGKRGYVAAEALRAYFKSVDGFKRFLFKPQKNRSAFLFEMSRVSAFFESRPAPSK